MSELKKSDIMENLLTTLINISGRKTTKGHAIFTMSSTIDQLKKEYKFLQNIKIKDIRYSEDEDPVSVMTDLDDAEPEQMGKAIHEIIANMNRSLGKGAGHFFIKELRTTLNEDYISSIKDLGVDLGIMQLEHEIEEIEKTLTKTN